MRDTGVSIATAVVESMAQTILCLLFLVSFLALTVCCEAADQGHGPGAEAAGACTFAQ